jgi:hypothetical protein
VKAMVKPSAIAHRADGGRVKKGKTNVTVIVNPGGGAGQASPVQPAPPVAAIPAPPPGPPPGLPPGMPPPGLGGAGLGPPPGLGGPPPPPRPGMPPVLPPGLRKRGGRVTAGQKGVRGQGPGDTSGPATEVFREGVAAGTPVQHTDGKTDGKDIGRPKPITYARGGSIGVGPHPPAKGLPAPKTHGKEEDKPAVGHAKLHMTAGAKSGVGRLQKIKAMHREYP